MLSVKQKEIFSAYEPTPSTYAQPQKSLGRSNRLPRIIKTTATLAT
jgi:hypothetical protein